VFEQKQHNKSTTHTEFETGQLLSLWDNPLTVTNSSFKSNCVSLYYSNHFCCFWWGSYH